MWWAVPEGIDTFSTWKEVTTVYHEGVPGHHLQIAQNAYRSDLLNRWQRKLCFVSGHGEGWALYAERLMDDLGYLETRATRMGMLDAHAFRAIRVIIDIGMHLQLEIPADNPWGFRPGERWTPAAGFEFLSAARAPTTSRPCASSSTAISAGPARRRRTRSVSGSGWRPATTPGRARAPTSTCGGSTPTRSTSGRSGWTRCAAALARV